MQLYLNIVAGTNPLDFGRSEATVRVNSISSNLCKLDLIEIFKELPQSNFPNSIHLPKGKLAISSITIRYQIKSVQYHFVIFIS